MEIEFRGEIIEADEYECGIDLAIPPDTPAEVIDKLFDELTLVIAEALQNSRIAAEWEVTSLGVFGERV